MKELIDVLTSLSTVLNKNDYSLSLSKEAQMEAERQAVYSLICPNSDFLPYLVRNTNLLYEQDILSNLLTGIPFLFLKGTCAAVYYPVPYRRILGDIDLIVSPQYFEAAYNTLKKNGYYTSDPLNGKERHVHFIHNGVIIELHRRFATLNSRDSEELMDGWLFNSKPVVGKIGRFTFPMLPDELNGLVLLTHINQHLENGLGLRQILDWKRRRIGVVRVGGGQIGGERLFVVAQAVAVGIAHSLAHHPREAHRVVCGPLGVVPADPTVAHSGDVAVGVGNHVLDVGRVVRRENAAVVVGDCRRVDVADAAENRVEAVEELVVVVHAVLVCIPEARVGADVAAGPVRRVGSDVVDGFEPGCDKEDAVEVDDGGVVRVVLNDDSGVFRTVRVEQDFTVLVRVGRVVYFSRDVAGEGRSGVVGGKNVACFIVGLLRIAPEKVEVFVLGKDRVGAGGDAGGSGAGRREHIVVMQA